MDSNDIHTSSDWEAFFTNFDASGGMSSDVKGSISPELSAISSFDSPFEDVPIGELDMIDANAPMLYPSFNADEIPSGPSFYPFNTGPPGYVHMQMDSAAPLTFQSNIWFPHSGFMNEVDIVVPKSNPASIPLPPTSVEVVPPTSQTIHHPTSDVTHLINTYFQLPSDNDLRVLLQDIVSTAWYLTNVHEPGHGVKRSIFLNFLAHNPQDPVYRCLFDDCKEFFPRQDRALGHIRKHFNYRPFVCTGPCAASGCEERFYCRSYLKTHLTRQKVSCSACSTRLYPQNMTRHLKTCLKSRTTRNTNTARQPTIYTRSRIRCP